MTNTKQARKGMARWALLLAFLFVNSVVALAQSTVTGVVKDDLGEPLAGTKVQVKGTNTTAMTDANGKFSIRANKGQTLVFSFVGFTNKTVVVDGKPMNIMLNEDAKTLNDVVVIGYGSLARKEVASSITSLRPQDMDIAVVTSPEQMLQGKVPGLVITNTSDPNGAASISLRGASSLREGVAMEPYYVVDGVPGVSLSLVAPEDIESIDVLRDASATAIYGSKAANGVIIVTTKKGSKSGRTSVTYSGYVAADKAMKTLDMMDGTQLLDFAKRANYDLSNYYDVNNPANTDWQKEGLRAAFTHSHNISINGGHNKTAYSASLSYLDKDGVVRGSDMNHVTARTFLQTSILKDHVDLSISLNGSVKNNHSNQAIGGGNSVSGMDAIDAMYYFNPLVPVRNADGSWYENLSISQNYNPLSIINEDRYNTNERMLQGVGKLTAHIIEGLDLNMNFSYQNKQWNYNNYNSTKSQIFKSDHGRASRSTVSDIDKQMEIYANYGHTWNEVHKLALMAGYSWEQQDHSDGFGVSTYNFYNDDLKYYDVAMAASLNNPVPNNGGVTSSLLSVLRMISFYARANYSYDNRYMFQATIRRDGSSAFGTDNRWGTFPSFSAAWRISEEKFMQNQNVFDDLKFRIGYGVSGNSLGFGAYDARHIYTRAGSPIAGILNGATWYYPTLTGTNANPNLKWERTGMFNVGLDAEFLGGRLGGTLEYYIKRTKDLIHWYAVSGSKYPYGGTMPANVGEISNKGVELTINAIPVQGREFQWNTTFTLSHNKNKVEKISNGEFSVNYIREGNTDIGGVTNSTVQRIMEGCPIGQFYLPEFAGYNENGVSIFNHYENGVLVGTTTSPNEGDYRKAGSAQPKVTFSWSNTLTWKKWSLSAFFQGVGGNKIFNAKEAYYSNMTNVKNGKNGLVSLYEQVLENPTRINDTNSQYPSTRYLEKGNYLRLSTLTLGYDFGRLGDWIQNLRLYATVNNVFTITGYNGCDPEISLGGLQPGIDWRQSTYPRTRTYLFGVNINF
ncbi:MAG: TonB-dependent receptor [Bacteroidaceae bacterium]|nr:TonB-dependent receptor [Bacteroidaceae bacterium]